MKREPGKYITDEFGKGHEKFTRIDDFGKGLRGLGGIGTSKIRVLFGTKLGKANRGRKLSPEEVEAVIEKMKLEGRLD
jgi:hypothetical protein